MLGFRAYCLELRVLGLGGRGGVSFSRRMLGFRVQGVKFRVWGLGTRQTQQPWGCEWLVSSAVIQFMSMMQAFMPPASLFTSKLAFDQNVRVVG